MLGLGRGEVKLQRRLITTCDLAWPAFSPGLLIREHSFRGGV